MKHNKKFMLAIVSFFLTAVLLLSGGNVNAKDVYNLRFGSFVPPAHHFVKNAYNPWMDIIHKESNGRLKITFYPSGALSGIFQMYDGVTKRLQDIAPIVPSFEGEKFPLTNVLETPFAVPNGIIGTHILNGPLWDKYLAKEYKDVKVLAPYVSTPYQLFTNKPVHSIDDLKGMRIRATGGVQIKVIEALGATPVSTEDAELYEAMQKGTIDGFLYLYASAVGWRLWEVADYVTEISYAAGVGVIIMNKAKWEALPRDLQLIMEYATQDLGYWHAWSYQNLNDEAKQRFIDGGTKIITVSSKEMDRITRAVQPVIKDWIAKRQAKGLPAQELYDFMKSLPELYGYAQ